MDETTQPWADTKAHDFYVRTEIYVRDQLRAMGQSEDADNPQLVGRITSDIVKSMRWLINNGR